MKKPFLPPDDLPPPNHTFTDELLRRQLEYTICKQYYQSCDRITQTLLSHCHWEIDTKLAPTTLIIHCTDMETYWYILSNLPQLGGRLEKFANRAKIRVFPPAGKGAPFETRLDEIQFYKDWF
ncbi:MAG: hypothetical protein AAF208_13925 [Cyanobacteria bacterium P01_A01_bin.45]